MKFHKNISIMFKSGAGLERNYFDHDVADREYRDLMESWHRYLYNGRPLTYELASDTHNNTTTLIRLDEIMTVLWKAETEEYFQHKLDEFAHNAKLQECFEQEFERRTSKNVGFVKQSD